MPNSAVRYFLSNHHILYSQFPHGQLLDNNGGTQSRDISLDASEHHHFYWPSRGGLEVLAFR